MKTSKKPNNGVSDVKCVDCGRFIKYEDLRSGKARHILVNQDINASKEEWDSLCNICFEDFLRNTRPDDI